MTFEQTALDCAEGCAARDVAKLIEAAAFCLQRAIEKADAFDRWRITAIMETSRCNKEGADKLRALSADLLNPIRSNEVR
jgi:hypothetical protein